MPHFQAKKRPPLRVQIVLHYHDYVIIQYTRSTTRLLHPNWFQHIAFSNLYTALNKCWCEPGSSTGTLNALTPFPQSGDGLLKSASCCCVYWAWSRFEYRILHAQFIHLIRTLYFVDEYIHKKLFNPSKNFGAYSQIYFHSHILNWCQKTPNWMC